MFWNDIVVNVVVFIFICSLIYLVYLKKEKRRISLPSYITSLFSLLTLVCLFFTPVESLFYTFPTAEHAAKYVYLDAPVLLAEGEETALLLNGETEEMMPLVQVGSVKSYAQIGLQSEME